jgi:hypothetical protein
MSDVEHFCHNPAVAKQATTTLPIVFGADSPIYHHYPVAAMPR